ncbi:DUF6250 domain-containing protein [Chitinophaga horti]|uniref:DUF6250 domain-containing protein n=1 Tax=Chitinophaga horti TaxID=2920382 RepID=A0ABY6J4U0_9BACT|nr:DUF6250 domain-containing protein [Chitinophaga horti]UYQ93637.1 DUF6250 domain-containing protein [Chitinophaga horti]
MLYKDDFTAVLDTAKWVVEAAPDDLSGVIARQGKLILDTKGGVTVWFKPALTGNYCIEFDRTIPTSGGNHNRLSDMNQFWLATDPHRSDLFTRNGVFEAYDSLRMFYVGMGGNYNSTTRFRLYEGDGRKTLLQEKNDSAHLLQADVTYHIRIIVQKDSTSCWVNGERLFHYKDKNIPTKGHFGFRSTWSHQLISRFRIYRL